MSEPVTTVIELGNSILLWLGGGSVVTIGISAFASKFMADKTLEKQKGKLAEELERLKGELTKEVETHKLTLRRAELLFEREVRAANAFTEILEQLRCEWVPGMEYDDAAGRIAESFGEIENNLKKFNIEHGVVLSGEARALVSKCRWMAAEGKFEFIGQAQEADPSKEAIDAAKELLGDLKNVEKSLLNALRI